MPIVRRSRQFLVPWLAFAALSGLGNAFVTGMLATLFGFVAGLGHLLDGLGKGDFISGAKEVVKYFPQFAKMVVITVAAAFAGGFFPGFFTALLGRTLFPWLSFIACLFALGIFYPFSFVVLALAFCGAILPMGLLTHGAARYGWDEPIRRWLQETWLLAPPRPARIAGMVLPVICWGILEIRTTYPKYVQHPTYARRIGIWNTWWSSWSMKNQRRSPSHSNSYCQSNLKQILLAVKQYQQDYDEFYPPVPATPSEGVGAIIQPYLKSTQVFQCPQEFYRYEKGNFASGDFTDYWVNARFYGLSEPAVSNVSSSVYAGDGNTGGGEGNSAYSIRNIPPSFGPLSRHFGGGIYAFADGHVRWYRPGNVSNMKPIVASGLTMVPQ
jgi:prepilin-type processing-associated H-X9-DG protein